MNVSIEKENLLKERFELKPSIFDNHYTIAEYLCQAFKDKVLYDPYNDAYLHYTGTIWEKLPPHVGIVTLVSKHLSAHIDLMMHEATDEYDTVALTNIKNKKSLNPHYVEGVIIYLKAMLAVNPAQFDADPYLLNVQNGTIDLRTSKFKQHSPTDLLTKMASVSFHPEAACPAWERFQCDITDDDEIIKAKQVFYGYCLSADTSAQKMAILYGTGMNGKSQEVELISHLLGNYAQTVSNRMFDQYGDHVQEDLAQLEGLRLAVFSELDKRAFIKGGELKAVVSGDRITVRRLYSHPYSMTPTSKIVVVTNVEPSIQDQTVGMRRRLLKFNYDIVIPPEKQIPNYWHQLVEEEGEGILNWLLEGWKIFWEKRSLFIPSEIRENVTLYFETQNVLDDWIEDCCEVGNDYFERVRDLIDSLQEWLVAHHRNRLSDTAAGRELSAKGFPPKRLRINNRLYVVRTGIRLIGSTLSNDDAQTDTMLFDQNQGD